MLDHRVARLVVLLPAVGAAFLTACPQAQPGCTRENCELMIDACRVEFAGAPADIAECTGVDRPPTRPDWAKYCVDACNAHSGNGEVASCIAAKADACRDAGTDKLAVISSCLTAPSTVPEPSCVDRCTAARRTCDDACSGGKPCDDCLRMGLSCENVCSDAGWSACLDCSAQCGIDFVRCEDACPRVP